MPTASMELLPGEVPTRSSFPKIPRPEVSGGCSQEDFKFFTRKWNQYVRSSNETDGTKLKDQLTHCPDDALRSALYKALGDRIETISMTDLLKEIEVMAVVQQTNNVNMISAKQERDETVCSSPMWTCCL
jgi:hypothetical protein